MNKVILIGRLATDPELRRTQSNTAVTSFTLAVDRRFAREGDVQADFVPVVAWSGTAEFAAKYFTKGQRVAVCGRLHNRDWTDKDGNKHRVTEIVADEVEFADGKREKNTAPVTADDFDEIEDDYGDSDLPF